ncbi:MAG: single-stranded-DNA-specific exonuclease RecJ [Ruminococcaceae bacterium]|nr:single-stranded-DNA-specific exonuclease RecJ [Oscillospiraceae bacterium]
MGVFRWKLPNENLNIKQILEAEGKSVLLSSVMASRYDDIKDVLNFLTPKDIGGYKDLKDIERGSERVRSAISLGEKIAIFGDYDADGIAAAAILQRYFAEIGGNVTTLLPSREEGYGLSVSSVDEIKELGCSLIVTVDNGISAHEAVRKANDSGIDVVITDHHKPGDDLPPAYAVINPNRSDDLSSEKNLAGVGVALKFASAVGEVEPGELLKKFAPLAAIGTVADSSELAGDNRVIVREGIDSIRRGEDIAIAALAKSAGLNLENIDSQDIAFVISPRVNAAGRIADALTALELFLTDDPGEAEVIAEKLNVLNSERREVQDRILDIAFEHNSAKEFEKNPIIVIAGEFSSGVSGIVSSRISERFNKPSVVISVEDGVGKGSARSVSGFSIFEALDSCRDILSAFGGHEMAAGFTLELDKIELLKHRLNEYCRLKPRSMPIIEEIIDSVVEFSDIDVEGIRELEMLSPFGAGNTVPVFATLGAEILSIDPLGKGHSKITFRKNAVTLSTASFGKSPDNHPFRVGDILDISYNLSIFRSKYGRDYISAKLINATPCSLDEEDYRLIDDYRLYRMGVEMNPGRLQKAAPKRETIVELYRKIKSADIQINNLEDLIMYFTSIPPATVLAAADVLIELSLVKVDYNSTGGVIKAVKDPDKKKLENSPTYRYLWEV